MSSANKDFLIRNMPPAMHRRLKRLARKRRAAGLADSMRTIALAGISQYLDQEEAMDQGRHPLDSH